MITAQYNNPIPVAVSIIPVETQFIYELALITLNLKLYKSVYVRRNIEPKCGMLALPGGFVNELERLETAGARELREETGLIIDEDEFELFRSEITPNNRNLIFGITPARSANIIQTLNNNLKYSEDIQAETQEFVIAGLNINNAAFPLHQKVLGIYFDKVNGAKVKNALKSLDANTAEEILIKLKEEGFLTQNFSLGFIHKNSKPQI